MRGVDWRDATREIEKKSNRRPSTQADWRILFIHDEIEEIGNYAFADCYSLSAVTVIEEDEFSDDMEAFTDGQESKQGDDGDMLQKDNSSSRSQKKRKKSSSIKVIGAGVKGYERWTF